MGGQIHSAYNALGALAFLTETGSRFATLAVDIF